MSAADMLEALFQSDPSAPDYFERFPMYRGDAACGARLHWPPLSEVWATGAECPDTFPSPAAWREAYEHLQSLHTRWRQAAGG